jgi:hypothetical protein
LLRGLAFRVTRELVVAMFFYYVPSGAALRIIIKVMSVKVSGRARVFVLALAVSAPFAAQIIEFESGGLHYQTQTKSGVTIMVAPLPVAIRGFGVMQVAISNGSTRTWTFRPQDFKYQSEQGATIAGAEARVVVQDFMDNGGRDDVIKLVTAYENGLYGMTRPKSTNGYEQRRQSVMAEMTSSKWKAAAAASAIVLVPAKLKPGESTDGAVFFNTRGQLFGTGKLSVEAGPSVYEFPIEKASGPTPER